MIFEKATSTMRQCPPNWRIGGHQSQRGHSQYFARAKCQKRPYIIPSNCQRSQIGELYIMDEKNIRERATIVESRQSAKTHHKNTHKVGPKITFFFFFYFYFSHSFQISNNVFFFLAQSNKYFFNYIHILLHYYIPVKYIYNMYIYTDKFSVHISSANLIMFKGG